ncbi:MAG: 50S ribosomal protein L21 [uncultured bacterium]|uniref:Large ribosomal subunit protein bL21 n=1 Tax=Candidatus Magasanikbacteria bacterium RIFOXYD2_FULL_36_9 TaxID=1798707 RepID=A0A1F6P1V2_9BACT|nr:MAG: 50S ribosomal protein L21 [uncultured bacterium]OGH89963.1 MAG: 50S ribosomal protein L21 [Candidatus Magasanikbacteria bacterium RIFOXYD2_FULL_36_9]
MISIIATGGKQYIVKSGEKFKFEKLKVDGIDVLADTDFTFDKVLLKADEEGNLVELGKPYLEGETVKAKVLRQGKTRTLRVEKFKSKVRFHKVHGQRQRFTEVQIV